MMKNLLTRTLAELKRVGIRPDRRRGQHFAVDLEMLQTLADASQVSTSDTILEIGGGLGTLSEYILMRGPKRLIVVERDPRLARFLRHRLSGWSNVEIVCGDYLKIEPLRYDKCVSNPPFNISSKIILKLVQERPALAVLTFQEEFAERLLAKAGTKDYGRLSVMAQMQFKIEKVRTFSNSSFYPPPKTAITVVIIRPREEVAEKVWTRPLEDLTRELFKYRRKKLNKALRLADLEPIFASNSLAQKLKDRRVFEIEPEELIELSKQLAYKPA